jgi:hypothetical protein
MQQAAAPSETRKINLVDPIRLGPLILANLVAFRQPFIANPDLAAWLRNEWMLAEAPKETRYGRCVKGYIGWPTYQKPPKDAAANCGQGI